MDINANKSKSDVENLFDKKVYSGCKDFIDKYNLEIEIRENNPAAMTLMELLRKFRALRKENKIYIIIDEYDHFTNGMLEGNVPRFVNSLGQGGFVRAFYEVIKEYTEGTDSVVDRFFATGISPLTLDSLTSGFNISTDLSTKRNYDAMCGFTEEEVKLLLKKSGLNESIYEELKKNYNGYRFSKLSENQTFNVTLLMYYLKSYLEDGIPPEQIIDNNLAASGEKIQAIVNLGNKEKNYEKLLELVTTGETRGRLVEKFDLNSLRFNEDSFLSLLFYNGYITIKNVGIDVTYCVPNYVSEILYAGYFADLIDTKEKYNMEIKEQVV